MKKYFEPEMNIVDYEALENIALSIGGDGIISGWNDEDESGNQEDFGF